MSSSDTSDPLSSLNCEQSDMYSITSEVESAEGTTCRVVCDICFALTTVCLDRQSPIIDG